MEHSKIAIVGAGNVGSTTAYAIMMRNVATEILLTDIDTVRCKGEILDLSDSLSFSETSKISAATPQEAGQADIIIIAAGAPQKPGQTRTELLTINKKIVTSVIKSLSPINPEAIIIMVANPVDLLTLHAQEIAGLPRNQVFGSGTFLDSQRLRSLLSKKLNIAEKSIHAYVLGEHGDTQFAAWSCTVIGGSPITAFSEITEKDLMDIPRHARERAYEIIACKGSTYYGIASCVAALCEDVLHDSKRLIPVSCYIESLGVCLSMPAVLGKNGVEEILPTPLNATEQQQLKISADTLRKLYDEARD